MEIKKPATKEQNKPRQKEAKEEKLRRRRRRVSHLLALQESKHTPHTKVTTQPFPSDRGSKQA